jgi:hypothetical protein
MVILLSSEDSDDEALLLKTAVAMMERRAIPKIGSFVDIVLSYEVPKTKAYQFYIFVICY